MVRKRNVYVCTGLGDTQVNEQGIMATYALLFREKTRR